jgi:hypothetical protein
MTGASKICRIRDMADVPADGEDGSNARKQHGLLSA